MKTPTRMIALVIVVTLVIGLLPHQPRSTIPPAAAQNPIEIRILVGLGAGSQPHQRELHDRLAQTWNATHDTIKIRFYMSNAEPAWDVLETSVAVGDPPEIVGPLGVQAFYKWSSLWLDLSEYIARDQTAIPLEDYNPAVLEIFVFQDQMLALPLTVSPALMFVNENLFKAAGVALPSTAYGDWTWDDVRTTAMALTQDAKGLYHSEAGFDVENIDIYGLYLFWTNFRGAVALFSPDDQGVVIHQDGRATATFDQEAILYACRFIHDGIFVDHFMPTLDAESGLEAGTTNPFSGGHIAMGVGHTWLFGLIKRAVESGMFSSAWNVYPLPLAPNGDLTVRVHADTFAITKDSQNHEAAWEVLKWLNSPEIALQLTNAYDAMPARLSIRHAWEARALANFPFLNVDVIYQGLDYADAPNHEGYLPNSTQAWDRLEAFWQELRAIPDLDVESALETTNAEVQMIFEAAE